MTKKEKIVLSLLVIFFFGIKLYIVFNTKISFGLTDDAIYASLARFFLQGNLKQAFHPTWSPLYPFLTSITYLLFNSWEKSGQIVSAISGSVIVVPFYFLAKKFLSKSLSLLFAVSAPLILNIFKFSVLPLSDMLSTALIISAITFVMYALTDYKNKYFYVSSFLFGLVYLTRSEGLMFFGLTYAFIIGWLILRAFSKMVFHKKNKITVKDFIVVPIFLIIFLLTISPYWIATKNQTGSWSLSQKAAAQIKQGHSFQLRDGVVWSQEVVSIKSPNYNSNYFKDGLTHILEYSDWFAFWFMQKMHVWKNLLLANFPIWSLTIAAIGLTSTAFFKNKSWQTLFIMYILISVIPITIFATPLSDPRYLLWAFPLILLLVFTGIQNISKFILKDRLTFLPLMICFLVILFLPTFDSLVLKPKAYSIDYTNSYYREEIVSAGNWLSDNSKNPKIMMRHEGVEFYSDGETIYIPQDQTLEKTIEYGKLKGAQYLIAWQDELAGDKNLFVLLDKNFKNKDLKNVYQFPNETPKIIIYSLN